MVYLTPKPKTATAWLPTQVYYGMDCSDEDPKNWKAFGQAAEVSPSKGAKPTAGDVARIDPPRQ